MASSVAADKKQTDRERRTDKDDINPSAAARSLSRGIGSFCAFDPFGRRFKCPCNDQCDRKTDDQKQNYQTNCPIGNLEKRKDLRRNLDEQPRDDSINDRNFVNVAPL